MTWPPISNEGTRRSQLYLDEEWNVEDAWEESWPDASFEVLLTGMTGRLMGKGGQKEGKPGHKHSLIHA